MSPPKPQFPFIKWGYWTRWLLMALPSMAMCPQFKNASKSSLWGQFCLNSEASHRWPWIPRWVLSVLNLAIRLGAGGSLRIWGTFPVVSGFVTACRTLSSGERGFRSDAGGVSLARGSGSEDANSWRRGELKEAASLSCHLPLSSDGSIRTLGSRTGRACHRCEGCGCPRLPANPLYDYPLPRQKQNLVGCFCHITLHNLIDKKKKKTFHCYFNLYLFDQEKDLGFFLFNYL